MSPAGQTSEAPRLQFHHDDSGRCPECGMSGGHRPGCPETQTPTLVYEEDHPDYEVES